MDLSIYLNLSIIAHKSGLLRQWEVDELAKPELVKTFRSIHTGPISLLKVSLFFSQKNSKVMQCEPLLRILLGAGVYIIAAQKIISYLTFFFNFHCFFCYIFLNLCFSGFFLAVIRAYIRQGNLKGQFPSFLLLFRFFLPFSRILRVRSNS